MSYAILEIAFNVIAYWIFILIMQYICASHMNLTKRSAVICTLISLPILTVFRDSGIICAILLVLLTVLVFSSRKGHDLLQFILAFTLYFVLDILPQCILEALFPESIAFVMIDGNSVSLIGMIVDILLLIGLILLRHVLLKYETIVGLNRKEILGCIVLLLFLLIDGGMLTITQFSQMQPVYAVLWKIIYVSAFLLSLGYYLFGLIESRVRIYRQAISRNETEYLRVQLDALQDIRENEEQVKQLRHDLNNHLAVIQSLCDEGNYNEIRAYTEHLRKDIVLNGSEVLTGNKVADLVVHSKLKTAREQGIDFTFSGSLAQLSSLDAPDICGLLANAYDNAIEACKSQENPYIHTKVSTTRNYTVIQIINSITHKVSIHGNRIATTKKDKYTHGYGIDIMHRITNKYNGRCTLHSSDNEFTVKIVLLTD